MKSTTYAVVDIETTGTDPKKDRIIQIGCVLIENEQIVSRFATDINPNQMISKQIQSLTGITNARVQKAPYFEDVALTIYNLLADTVFVAHNIYFDYKFLNHELQRCGAPELKIPGIDTVELAQIFLPTETSFRLSDLAESLGLSHSNPHQADSDAEVTGGLLLKIQEKIRRLPLITVERIVELSALTGMETQMFIEKNLLEMRQQTTPLAPELQIVDGLALRNKATVLYEETHYGEKSYPKTAAAKKHRFGQTLAFRKEQHQLMNLTYQHFIGGETKDLLVEAATGMGKTIGYLYPLSFLATPENPAVISTASIVLQQQIMEKDIPMLNQFLERPIQGTLVKSSRHYLDLQRFRASLSKPQTQKQYALYQMMVLVWLTETETGDFAELHMTSLNHSFWEDVRHRGSQFLAENQPFYQEDFWRHLQQKIKQSNFLIVNHAYLAQESLRQEPQLPSSDYLLIDEAHHLSNSLEKVTQQQFSGGTFKKRLQQLRLSGQLFDQLQQLLSEKQELQRRLRLYRGILDELLEEQEDFFRELQELVPTAKQGRHLPELVVEKSLFDQLSPFGSDKLERCLVLFEDLRQLQAALTQGLLLTVENWSYQERGSYGQLFQWFDFVSDGGRLFEIWTQDWRPQLVHWLRLEKGGEGFLLAVHDYQAADLPKTVWYPRYQKIMYVGGTIKVGNDRHYFPNRWGLTETKVKLLKNPYDLARQVKVFVPTEGAAVAQDSAGDFVQQIAETLLTVARQEERRILVLFTAHEALQQVYYAFHQELLDQGREVFAQGLSGSREKVLKRFFLADTGILLGADSFWEGIDLPGDTLQLLLVTRLPFENPQRPLVKARYHYLQSQGINAFYQEAVPKAALKLRQALGRLIRSEKDRGVMLILDRRIVTAGYSKRLQKAFPKEVAIEEKALPDILTESREFLQENPKDFEK